jgi:hypothetical protein
MKASLTVNEQLVNGIDWDPDSWEKTWMTNKSYWTSSSRSILEEQPKKNEVHMLRQ